MVNATGGVAAPATGGFLALRFLETGTNYATVGSAEHYVCESALLGVRGWFNRLLLGVGFAARPAEGYTWLEVVDAQLEIVRFIEGLPTSERPVWRAWADRNFREHGLERAQIIFKDKLLTSRPADEVVSWFLPNGAAFFTNIANKRRDAAPIAVVRRAFPNYFPSEPVSLPGTTASSSSSGGDGGGGGGGKDKKRKLGGGGGGTQADGAAADEPGSKAGLTRLLSDGKLFHCGRAIDIKEAAKKCGVQVGACCWPVLFSKKKGGAALALCPDPASHGGIDSKWHKQPKGFNQDKFFKAYSSAATAA